MAINSNFGSSNNVMGMKQERYATQEYRELTGQKQSNKYRNIKTEVDGIRFHSRHEANHYCELKILKQQQHIIDFFRQVPFLLHEGYWKDEAWVKPIYYVADFLVVKQVNFSCESIGNKIVFEIHEPKGKWTRTALDKRKMFEKRYPEYKLVVI